MKIVYIKFGTGTFHILDEDDYLVQLSVFGLPGANDFWPDEWDSLESLAEAYVWNDGICSTSRKYINEKYTVVQNGNIKRFLASEYPEYFI